jgi:hypothetical protein
MSTITLTNEWIAFLEKLLADVDKNKTIVDKLHELYKQREVYQQNKKLNEAVYADISYWGLHNPNGDG